MAFSTMMSVGGVWKWLGEFRCNRRAGRPMEVPEGVEREMDGVVRGVRVWRVGVLGRLWRVATREQIRVV